MAKRTRKSAGDDDDGMLGSSAPAAGAGTAPAEPTTMTPPPSPSAATHPPTPGNPRPTFFIIDGFAQLFRAYHAIRTAMASPVTSEPTNATFGWSGMLLKVLREYRPDYLAIVVDVSGDRGTFRSEIYEDYKANRQPPPMDLLCQIDRSLEVARLLGIPVLGAEGFEADDVIATLVERLLPAAPDLEMRIVSKDKDLEQLLHERVSLIDVHKDEINSVETLRQNKGITPEQVIDYLALMGDTVDNVPGVPGIGPKTAAELISAYGSIEGIYAHIEEIRGKRRENLEASRDKLPLSRTLVTLRRDVPIEFDLATARVETSAIAARELMSLFKTLGFNRLRDELSALTGAPVETALATGASEARSAGRMPQEIAGSAAAATADGGGAPPDESLFGPLFGGLDGGAAGTGASAVADVGEISAEEMVRLVDGAYHLVDTLEVLETLCAELRTAPRLAVDTETTSTNPVMAQLCGISVSAQEREGYYIPVRGPKGSRVLDLALVRERLGPILADAAIEKIGQNLKYDLIVLRRHGFDVRGIAFDSMIASFVLDPSRPSHGMDALAEGLLGHRCIPISALIGRKGRGREQKTFDQVPLELATPYAAEDADITLRLRNCLQPLLEREGLVPLFADVEMPLVEVLAEMEMHGVRVDPAVLAEQKRELQARIDDLRNEIIASAPRPFNLDSPRQLGAVLFNRPDHADPAEAGLGLKVIKRNKTGPSTDIEVLERLANDPEVTSPVPALIVEYRQLTKLVGTYLESLTDYINPETGRIHASFHQTVAATGRLSSSDPNLQNIPIRSDVGRRIRRAFVAENGCKLITADYSQIELRILAHLSEDENLIKAFHEGVDIHTAVAAEVFEVEPEKVTSEQRSSAKMVNFGIVYGVTAFGLARRLGEGVNNQQAAKIIDDYKARYPGINRFLRQCVDQARELGYVKTMLGRRRPVPQAESRNPREKALAERIAINSVVQGSAADLIKLAMLRVHRELPAASPRARMILQIHDELVFEVPEGEVDRTVELVRSGMEGAMSLKVPLVVGAAIADNWMEAK